MAKGRWVTCMGLAALAAAGGLWTLRSPGVAPGWGATPEAIPRATPGGKGEAGTRWEGPTGQGVRVAVVEGNPADYLPHRTDPRLEHVRIHARSGEAKSNHHATTSVATLIGRTKAAPGAPGVREIDALTTGSFMSDQILHAGTTDPPSNPFDDDVFSHAWIGSHPLARDVLRRIDFLIDSQDVVMCVGVNNGKGTAVPELLASGYNSIAVGSQAGDSSGGFSRFEGEGRCKPDLVGPNAMTSFATAQVSAAAARLIEAARPLFEEGANPTQADRAQARPPALLIKALLLAGASKPKNWRPDGRPLDEHLGAGMLDFDAALAILHAGRLKPAPGKIRQSRGYDLPPVRPDRPTAYRFDASQDLGELSIILAWHRKIDGRTLTDMMTGQTRWIDAAQLADMDLRLTRLDDRGVPQVVAESRSFVDNVEHIHLPVLHAGRYVLEITRKDGYPQDWDAALALRIGAPSKSPQASVGQAETAH